MTVHTNKQYDQELEALRCRLMEMGGLVEAQIRAAMAGYIGADAADVAAVISGDAKVNELELAIDDALGQLIVRRQPAASDLRLILAASKIVTDLERIGDEAAKIARMASEAVQPVPLGHMSSVALRMLRHALDAFARLDAAAAAAVCREDAAIDEEFRSILRQLMTRMAEDPMSVTAGLQVVWAAKAFERIGDHARNIAEHVIYIVKGRDVRHIPLAQLEREALGR
jgi:phosphate transport system protein